MSFDGLALTINSRPLLYVETPPLSFSVVVQPQCKLESHRLTTDRSPEPFADCFGFSLQNVN